MSVGRVLKNWFQSTELILCFIVIKSHLLKLMFSNIDVDGFWEFCVALFQTGIQVFANNRQWSDKYVSVMQILSISAGLLKVRSRMFCLRVGSVTNCSKK